jgi:hypothetical protein
MPSSSVQFLVGNTYQKLRRGEEQHLDRTGTFRKDHDWTLYVDVVNGDPNQIQLVKFDLPSFEPREFVCSCPVAVKRQNGSTAWRFATRQQSYGSINATIKIRGTGGSLLTTQHQITLEQDRRKPPLQSFRETRGAQPLRILPLPETQKFGIELELTSPMHMDAQRIASYLEEQRVVSVEVAGSYSEGLRHSNFWKIVPDSSIYCSPNLPGCNKFELVSPILVGGNGLQSVNRVVSALSNLQLQVNKSMGFHVHVDVSELSLQELIKVCQNFIKYEDIIDTFMPPSRRSDSPECDQYFRSNKEGLHQDTNKQRHYALKACGDVASLARKMNREGRYYKLNLQNLVTGRQPTLEFRQHSATINYNKIGAWVRFCVALVRNSARLPSPTPFRESRTLDDKFDALFMYVIKDRALREFYRQRRHEHDGDEGCCSGCAMGGSCSK